MYRIIQSIIQSKLSFEYQSQSADQTILSTADDSAEELDSYSVDEKLNSISEGKGYPKLGPNQYFKNLEALY